MENKINHLQMIQGVINRMASNSFALKGWAVTLVAGIFALASRDSDKLYFLVSYIPCVVFWGLDSYYLLQERLYRALYNEVRNKEQGNIDFSMDASGFPRSNSLTAAQKEKLTYVNCFKSRTEIWFYVPLIAVCTVVILLGVVSKNIS